MDGFDWVSLFFYAVIKTREYGSIDCHFGRQSKLFVEAFRSDDSAST